MAVFFKKGPRNFEMQAFAKETNLSFKRLPKSSIGINEREYVIWLLIRNRSFDMSALGDVEELDVLT